MIYPENFETKIGFDKIRILLKKECLSPLGEGKIDEMRFMKSAHAIETALVLTEEFRLILMYEDGFPSSYFIDATPALKRIRLEGTFLSTQELFDLVRSLGTIGGIVRFFRSDKAEKYPELVKLTANLEAFEPVLREMNRIMDRYGNIKDSASPELSDIRRSLTSKLATVSRISRKVLEKAKTDGWIDKDAQLTVRDGKMLIPVSATHKRKISGFIYDESATGKTSFIEPAASVEANNQIRELEIAEKREIVKILITFTDFLRPEIDPMLYAYDMLAELDFIRAKAIFATTIQAEKPNISQHAELDLRTAKHPLLFLSFRKEKRSVVPLDVQIDKNQRIVLISGPNAGGKSVCLKTTGLLQYMVQHGLLVSANKTSTFGVFHHIFIDIGDEQSLENDLSTYSSHLANMKAFTENSDSRSLILIDEFGTGTEPAIGAAIAEAVLEKLLQNNAKGIITTHYTNLKNFAAETNGITNGAMLFDSKELQPLFQLRVGKPGSSFAFEIAGKIGLSKEILKSAGRKIGSDHLDFEKQLQDIERDKYFIENQKKKLQQLEKKLEADIAHYDFETQISLKHRKDILKEAKDEAQNMLTGVNKRIENTISEIKKSAADKEKTKDARRKIEDLKKSVFDKQNNEVKQIEARMEKIRRRQERKKEEKEDDKAVKTGTKPKKEIIDNIIIVGDAVRLKNAGAIAEVLEIKGKKLVVSIGHMRAEVKLKDAEKVSKNQIKRVTKSTQPDYAVTSDKKISEMRAKFKSGLDVRGLRGEEAIDKVRHFIDQATVVAATQLTILHGTGSGILRTIIREYLDTVDVVDQCKDERIENGGAGITVVTLDY